MKKAVLFLLCGAFVMGLSLSSSNQSASGKPAFKKEFDKKYPNLATASAAAKCNVCHVPDQEKTARNAYGMEISKYIKKTEDKDLEKIQKALGQAESGKGAGGKTFGELIKEGKLPGGS